MELESLYRVFAYLSLGKPQKNFFLVARPLRGGGGGCKGLATKKITFFYFVPHLKQTYFILRFSFFGGGENDIFGYRDTKLRLNMALF